MDRPRKIQIVFGVSACILGVCCVGLFLHRTQPATPTSVARSATRSITPSTTPIPSPSTPPPLLTLTFGGDIMLGRTVETRMKTHGDDWPLKKLGPTMAAADISVANLESPFREDAPTTQPDSLILRGYPPGIANLQEAGIDLVSLANNHITDMGLAGLQQTKTILTDRSILSVGAGETDDQAAQASIITRQGLKIGFLSYTYGVNFNSPGVHYNIANPNQVTTDVVKLKQSVDSVVVLVHFGTEYQTKPNAAQITFAHAAVDAGATLVIGAHPHVVEPMEQYKNGLIFYSLGNLVFDQAQGAGRDYSALVSITMSGTALKTVQLFPYKIYNYGQPILLTTTEEQQSVWNMFNVPGGTVNL